MMKLSPGLIISDEGYPLCEEYMNMLNKTVIFFLK